MKTFEEWWAYITHDCEPKTFKEQAEFQLSRFWAKRGYETGRQHERNADKH